MKKITRKSIDTIINKTSNFMSYAEDLMQLSVEMNVPIIVAIQTNKTGVRDSNDIPELDTIRNSDCILHNASRAISITNNTDNSISKINKILERRIK